MEISNKFGFYLPSRDEGDPADIDQISYNFKKVDEQAVDKSELEETQKEVEETKEQAKNKVDYKYAHQNFANALKGKVEGNPVAIKDASPLEHEVTVRVERKNLLPSIEEQTHLNVDITPTDDGGYVLNGTTSDPAGGFSVGTIPLEAGTYTFSVQTNAISGVSVNYLIGDINNGFSLDELHKSVVLSVSVAGDFEYKIRFNGRTEPFDNFKIKPVLIKEYTPVAKYGKNLLSLSEIYKTNETDFLRCEYRPADGTVKSKMVASTYCQISVRYLEELLLANKGKLIVFSVKKGNENAGTAIVLYDQNNTSISTAESYSNVCAIKIPQDATGFARIGLRFNRTASEENWGAVLSDFQLEIGDTATEYEPYIEPTDYTADENGVVNGITAQGDGFTLFADDGATITAEYNRDINKAFAELQALILGG